MADLQYARGIWGQFRADERPFMVANGMEDNLRLIDDHLGLYTLRPPMPADSDFPTNAQDGDGQIFTDGTYAVLNAGAVRLYKPRRGIQAVHVGGTDAWFNTGSSWEQFSVMDTAPVVQAAVDAVGPLVEQAVNAAADAAAASSTVTYLTRAAMLADTSRPEGTQARVIQDPIAENNKYYTFAGGAWQESGWQPARQSDVDSVTSLIRLAPNPVLVIADEAGFGYGSFDADGGLRTVGFEVSGADGAIRTAAIRVEPGADFSGAAFVDGNGFIGLLIGGEDEDREPDEGSVAGPAPNYGGQLAELKHALTDPLHQYIGVVLIGDSITWGSSASGTAAQNPRDHALADPRNNGTSRSWANLLHRYLGRDYYESAVTETGWPGSPSGVAQFEYSRTIDLFAGSEPFIQSADGGSWSVVNAAGSALGVALDGASAGLSQTASLVFKVTGRRVSVVVQARADGGAYELFVDGISNGAFSSSTAVLGGSSGYGYVHTHTFDAFKRGAWIELRLVPSASATVLRIEAIRVNRQLRVTNQGIIGTNTREWASSLLAGAVRADDSFAFVQLGTNDRVLRASGVSPAGWTGTAARIASMLETLKAASVHPVLLCANATTDALASDMSLIRAALHRVARERRVDFIDQFALMRPIAGPDYVPDDVHPNDAGHQLMATNIRNRIEGL